MELKLKCPLCTVVATGDHRLRTHLMGTYEYGGHELDREKAGEHIREAIRVARQRGYGSGGAG